MRIYHIVVPAVWEAAEGSETYAADSLADEGFIHCSFESQLPGVLGRYYRGAGELVVLEIEPDLLTSDLVIEPSTGGEEYPHIYGEINISAVKGTRRVTAPE